MKLYANNIEVVSDCSFAKTYVEKFFGLMFKKQKDFTLGNGLIFKNCSSIHMFFMFFPIDVVFLSKEFKVLKIVKGLKINHIAFGPKGTFYTLELPLNGSKNIKEHDNLLLK